MDEKQKPVCGLCQRHQKQEKFRIAQEMIGERVAFVNIKTA